MAALLWGTWALVTRSPGDGPIPGAPPVTDGPQTEMNERRIRISADAISVVALLNDSPTADRLWQELPVTGRVQLWGDEIYFSIPVEAGEAGDAQETVDKGAVAFWPPANALCLFWGPTPMSRGDEIRPASAVNVVGQIDGDPEVLGGVTSGARITVERSEE